MKIGEMVAWTQEDADGSRTIRTGQVWANAPRCHDSPTVWVVPEDGRDTAVAVARLRKGKRGHHSVAGGHFSEGDLFSETAPLSATGALGSANKYHAYITAIDNANRRKTQPRESREMTNTVKRGAGRKAHAERTERHAQRGPQVSKAASAEAIRKEMAEATKPEPIKPTRKRAARKPAGTESVASLLPGAPAAAPPKRKRAPKPEGPKTAPAPVASNVATGEPHLVKADALAKFGADAGWAAVVEPTDAPSGCRVVARRDPETLTVTFIDNKLDLDVMPIWEDGSGRRVTLRNVSAARKQMGLSAEDRPARPIRPRAKVADEPDETPRRSLPFDAAEADDDAVLQSLDAARVRWTNRTSGTDCSAIVIPGTKALKIEPHPHKTGLEHRIVTFMSVEGTYRSVTLSNILSIRPLTARQRMTVDSEVMRIHGGASGAAAKGK